MEKTFGRSEREEEEEEEGDEGEEAHLSVQRPLSWRDILNYSCPLASLNCQRTRMKRRRRICRCSETEGSGIKPPTSWTVDEPPSAFREVDTNHATTMMLRFNPKDLEPNLFFLLLLYEWQKHEMCPLMDSYYFIITFDLLSFLYGSEPSEDMSWVCKLHFVVRDLSPRGRRTAEAEIPTEAQHNFSALLRILSNNPD